MKLAKTYMVRKPMSFKEVVKITKEKQRSIYVLETVRIEETIELGLADYQKLCRNPLNDYEFLKGKGGYDDGFMRKVVEIVCAGKQTLFVDPSGSSYCRYLGLGV